jgi:1,4-alpha-glucan branching enzyme
MLKKKFLKTKCKVEFVFPSERVAEAAQVHLVGDFNQWNESSHPMEKSGKHFKLSLDLELDQRYQFRYLVNGTDWHNDWEADEYVPNAFGGENSVVSTQAESA